MTTSPQGPSRPQIVLPAGVYIATFRLLSRLYGFKGALLGLVLLIGGASRFTSPAFATARAVPGGVGTWGVVALTGGLVMLYGSWTGRLWPLLAGVLTLILWDVFFSFTFTVAAISNSNTGLTGCVTFGGCAAWGGLLLSALRAADRPERPGD